MNLSHSCPLCKASKKFQKFRTNKIFGKIGNKKRAFYQCLNCDIFYLFPRLNKKEEKKFYEKDFEKFMGDRSKRKNDWRDIEKHIISNNENKLRRFKYLKNLIKGKKNILEYGCSSGFMLFPLIQKNYNCYGIEPSGKFYDYLISKNLKIYKNENEFIKKNKNQKLDVIMHFFVMEHIFNLKEFINNQMNLLNKTSISFVSNAPENAFNEDTIGSLILFGIVFSIFFISLLDFPKSFSRFTIFAPGKFFNNFGIFGSQIIFATFVFELEVLPDNCCP